MLLIAREPPSYVTRSAPHAVSMLSRRCNGWPSSARVSSVEISRRTFFACSGSLGRDGRLFENSPRLIEELIGLLDDRNILHEYECFDIGMVVTARKLLLVGQLAALLSTEDLRNSMSGIG
jgi:beta-keto acid cleavage enzyme